MGDILMEALRETLVVQEHLLDSLDEIIMEGKMVLAVGVKDGKAKVIYVGEPYRKER